MEKKQPNGQEDHRLTRADTPFAAFLRKQKLSYEKAAQKVSASGHKVTGSTIRRIANGEEPRPKLARAIEEALGYPAKDLIPL